MLQKITVIFVAMLFVISVFLQTHISIYVYQDELWLLHCAQLVLQGKQYFYDFVETNPPLILLFYMPGLFIAKWLHIKMFSGWLIYMFSLVGAILAITYRLLKRIFDQESKTFCFVFILLAVLLLFLPMLGEFGEREHCTVLLILPYVLGVVLRLNKQPLTWYESSLYGVLAGIGFAIKPYFLVPLVLGEIYFLYRQRRVLAWIRPETISIALVMLVYICIVWSFFRAYLTQLLPFEGPLYAEQIGGALYSFRVLVNEYSLPGVIGLIMVSMHVVIKKNHASTFVKLLCVLAIGFYISAILGYRIIFYHYYPMLFMVLLVVGYMTIQTWYKTTYYQRAMVIMLGMTTAANTFLYIVNIFSPVLQVILLVSIVITIFIGVFCQMLKEAFLVVLSGFLGLASVFVIFKVLMPYQALGWLLYVLQYPNAYGIVLIFLIPALHSLGDSLFINKIQRKICHKASLVVILINLLIAGFLFSAQDRANYKVLVNHMRPLIQYVEKIKHKNILIISYLFEAPAIMYGSHNPLISRFPSATLWIGGLHQMQMIQGKTPEYFKLRQQAFNMFFADINRHPPAYLAIQKLVGVPNKYSRSLMTLLKTSPRFMHLLASCHPDGTTNKYYYFFRCHVTTHI